MSLPVPVSGYLGRDMEAFRTLPGGGTQKKIKILCQEASFPNGTPERKTLVGEENMYRYVHQPARGQLRAGLELRQEAVKRTL